MLHHIPCPDCHQARTRKAGKTAKGAQRLRCCNPDCPRKVFIAPQDRYQPRFANDPTGKKYMQAYRAQKKTKVYLLSGRTDWETPDDIFQATVEVRWLKGRVKFDNGKTGAPFPSVLVIFRPPGP